ncbi:hypothetical protein [Roseicella frigidaeris]|uniref:Lipoprotein n=1 Tax=Roseicella frigidaeris TaxID=2230885 RepID=A0A327LWJ8_9PROT|nr:hypothetical protein [Roseicella frigidaeris]RAI54547.1 hypothetical protein DOO78_26200 [Roseicella frigidaeris]
MTRLMKATGASLALLLAAGLAACAPQQQAAPPGAAAPSAPGTVAATPAPGDHQAWMAHCAEMRQQIRQGAPVSPDMQRMVTYCQHMDHTMGAQRGRSGPYP